MLTNTNTYPDAPPKGRTGWWSCCGKDGGEATFHDKSFVHATQAPPAPAEDQGLNYSERKSKKMDLKFEFKN